MAQYEASTSVVTVIYSSWSIERLKSHMRLCLKGDNESLEDHVGSIHLMHAKGQVTNRAIAPMTSDFYQRLAGRGYDRRNRVDFVVQPYKLNDHNFPGENCTRDWYIPIPKDLGWNDQRIDNFVEDRLAELVHFELVPAQSWEIKIPLSSREKGTPRGTCYIKFDEKVSVDTLAAAKVVMDDTTWLDEEEEQYLDDPEFVPKSFRVFWSRDLKKVKAQREAEEKDGKPVEPRREGKRQYKPVQLCPKGKVPSEASASKGGSVGGTGFSKTGKGWGKSATAPAQPQEEKTVEVQAV